MARMKSTGNGEGSTVTLKRNGHIIGYAAELTVGWENGKRIKKRGKVQKTKAAARAELAELKRQRDAGIDLASRPQTIETFLTAWISDTFAQRAAPKSIADYHGAAKHINAHLGSKPLAKLTGQQVQAFFTYLSKDGKTRRRNEHEQHCGLAPRTVHVIRTVLYSALDQAVKWHLIPYNPAEYVTLPKITRSKAPVLQKAEARTLLDAARGERYELALRLMLALGLRRGEVCGLRWDDIDFTTNTITINGTLGYVVGVGLHHGPPKTDAGRRSIKLPAALIAGLRWHQTRQEAERAAMGDKWIADSPYVFVSPVNGGPLNSNALYTTFKAVAARAGLPTHYSPHTLRHSCASFLYAEGATDKTVSAFLGHATTQITRDLYIHLLGGELDDVAERVSDLLDYDNEPAEQQRRKQK